MNDLWLCLGGMPIDAGRGVGFSLFVRSPQLERLAQRTKSPPQANATRFVASVRSFKGGQEPEERVDGAVLPVTPDPCCWFKLKLT